MYYFLIITLFLLSFNFIGSKPVNAQTIIEQRPFNYGTLVVTRNDQVYSMRIQQNGSISPIDPELIQLGSVTAARFDFIGFAPNTSPTYSFVPTTLTGPGGNYFTLNNFEFPSQMSTDNSGNRLNRDAGSTISTSGNGLPYSDGTYTGTVLLTITYP